MTKMISFPRKGGRKKPVHFIVGFLLLMIFGSYLYADQLPTFGKVSEFSFADQNKQPFSNSNLEGQVWIANFIFTRCQGLCPLLTGQMAVLGEKLKNQNIKFISFSVDPEHDTSEVLSQYAMAHHVPEGKWFFVTTGKNQNMWDFVSRSFMLGAGEATAEDLAQGAEPVMHSSRFVLVDAKGFIRGYYDSQDPQKMDDLARDASSLLSL